MTETEPEQDAVVPLYLKVAAALRGDLADRHIAPGTRLPSERSLAHRYHVNRQTVRSALHLLREERLVVTDRRGTFAAGTEHEPRVPALTIRRQLFPGGADAADALVRASLMWEAPPAGLVGRLGLVPGEPTLVHRHVVLSPGGNPMQRSVSWFSRAALAEIPQLAKYRRTRGSSTLQPDLRLLYHWMHQAGLRLTRRESIAVPPAAMAGGGGGAPRLAVHRVVCDQHGHALEITDIDCAAQGVSWTYEFSG
ncbi:GntR family transcriptional regulator [Streptomyces sp. NPDC056524]|uniref:GntR family transcriptional regulator n=1 Tax=Streptomyces sp. NPDC056524 TaxID=3345851 RepID=UPI0036BA24BE